MRSGNSLAAINSYCLATVKTAQWILAAASHLQTDWRPLVDRIGHISFSLHYGQFF